MPLGAELGDSVGALVGPIVGVDDGKAGAFVGIAVGIMNCEREAMWLHIVQSSAGCTFQKGTIVWFDPSMRSSAHEMQRSCICHDAGGEDSQIPFGNSSLVYSIQFCERPGNSTGFTFVKHVEYHTSSTVRGADVFV